MLKYTAYHGMWGMEVQLHVVLLSTLYGEWSATTPNAGEDPTGTHCVCTKAGMDVEVINIYTCRDSNTGY